MRALIFIFALLIVCTTGRSQYAGYAGKKLSIKAKSIYRSTVFLSGLDLEYSFLRNTSIGLAGDCFFYSNKQLYDSRDYVGSANFWGDKCTTPEEMPDKAKITVKSVSLQLKQYLNTAHMLPAPNGLYLYVKPEFGFINVQGSYYLNLVVGDYDECIPDQKVNYHYKNMKFFSISGGMGFQKVYNATYIAGISIGMRNNQYITLSNNNDRIARGALYNFGPTVATLQNYENNTTIGVDANVVFGILLF